jgi:hypothetical protein
MQTRDIRRLAVRTSGIAATLALLMINASCRDPGMDEGDADDAVVKTVTAYGVTLDASASPQDVAYVLLRAIRDDVLAAKRGDNAAREEAEALERSIAAPKRIHQLVKPYFKQSGLPEDVTPARTVRSATRFWAPIAAHYVGDLDLTPEAARARMVLVSQSADVGAVHVDVENPNDHRRTTLAISVAKENGYWRVFKVDYTLLSVERMSRRREVVAPPESQPASAPASSPAGRAS